MTRVLERVTLGQEVERLRAQLTADGPRRRPAPMNYEWPFMNSVRMHAVKDMIDRVAGTDATVLVWGESGVGKELVTRAIHDKSPRRDRPFVKVNCAALPLELLESELFGYERGAFTGAHRQKPGKFELANTGTIFLDEIGEMPMPVQAKLLQVLQDREFSRLGSQSDIRVDVRVIAATNKDLARLVQHGHFREDLYYRLNVLNIHVPPLRERQEEIPVLVEYFLDRVLPRVRAAAPGSLGRDDAALHGPRLAGQRPRAGEHHQAHRGPRQRDPGRPGADAPAPGSVWSPADRGERPPPSAATAATAAGPRRAAGTRASGCARSPAAPPARRRRSALREVLDRVRWHRVEAARRLKVSYKTLLRKMQECGLATEPIPGSRGAR